MRRTASRLFSTLLSLMFFGIICVGCVYFYMMVSLPSVAQLKDVRLQVPMSVYSQDHQLMAVFGEKRRIPITVAQTPPLLIKAILATEDSRFFEHPGVDVIGLVRASVQLIATGKKSQGASTITMQVARNFFLTRKKTYSRKINEILLAIKISQTLSKEKVLELYLNKIYLGHRAYGVAAAAEVYYGQPVQKLALPQIAMLAGLPQAPSRENPITNPKAAKKRRNHVLGRLLDHGYITQAQYQHAIAVPITAKYHGQKVQLNAPYAAEMVRDELYSQYKEAAYTRGFVVRTTIDSRLQRAATSVVHNGIIAYDRRHGYRGPEDHWQLPPEPADSADNTESIDAQGAQSLQQAWAKRLAERPNIGGLQAVVVWSVAERSVVVLDREGKLRTLPWSAMAWARPYISAERRGPAPQQASDILRVGDVIRVQAIGKNKFWRLSQLPAVQAALVAMDDQTGAIKALSGGFSFEQSHYNRATQANRQPGSSFKPFIYAAALAKGYTLASVFNDAPIVIEDSGEQQWWRPHNSENQFYGPTRLRTGLVKSRNLLTIRLLQAVGINYTRTYLRRFGFPNDAMPKSLSLALGSGVLTPLELTTGYAIIANGGHAVPAHIVAELRDSNGQIISPASANAKTAASSDTPNQAISPQVAFLVNKTLESVITRGTGRRALVLKRTDLAGKTGTTNDKIDAWFAGYGGGIVTTVWMGFDQPSPLAEYGSQAALPLWIQFMRVALDQRPLQAQEQPDGVVQARINRATGLLAQPDDRNVMFEYFRQAHAPQQMSPGRDEQWVVGVQQEPSNQKMANQEPIF
jgi:penicillin-binding protein 1A